jgi:hypothetical protein
MFFFFLMQLNKQLPSKQHSRFPSFPDSKRKHTTNCSSCLRLVWTAPHTNSWIQNAVRHDQRSSLRSSSSFSSFNDAFSTLKTNMIFLIVVLLCILISMKFSFQQMHYLLKHEVLQLVFKCSFFSPYMFWSPWPIFRAHTSEPC